MKGHIYKLIDWLDWGKGVRYRGGELRDEVGVVDHGDQHLLEEDAIGRADEDEGRRQEKEERVLRIGVVPDVPHELVLRGEAFSRIIPLTLQEAAIILNQQIVERRIAMVVVMVMRRIWSRRQKGRLLILPRLIDRHVVLCRRSKCGAQQNRQMPENNK